jgi:hypothetical protein
MARIKIKDLPRDRKISKDELKKVMGGIILIRRPLSIVSSPMRSNIGRASAFISPPGPCIMTVTE